MNIVSKRRIRKIVIFILLYAASFSFLFILDRLRHPELPVDKLCIRDMLITFISLSIGWGVGSSFPRR